MPEPIPLTVTLDRATGTAELRKRLWHERIAISDLPGRLEFYRRLWSRGSKASDQPGPWARFYEQDIRALTRAITEAGHGRD